MRGIAARAQQHGYECRMLCAPPKPGENRGDDVIRLGNPVECALQRKLNKFTGRYGMVSSLQAGSCFKSWSDSHRISCSCITCIISFFDLSTLFGYLKKHRIPTVWTLHDCWAFTGHCAHYMMNGCERWRTGCGDCPRSAALSSHIQHYSTVDAQKAALYANMENLFFGGAI